VLSALAVVMGGCYAGGRWRTLLALWWPFAIGNAWWLWQLLGPEHPWAAVALIAVFAAIPAFMLTVIVADMTLGLFPLDTFYGLIAVVFLTPGFFVLNLVLWGLA